MPRERNKLSSQTQCAYKQSRLNRALIYFVVKKEILRNPRKTLPGTVLSDNWRFVWFVFWFERIRKVGVLDVFVDR